MVLGSFIYSNLDVEVKSMGLIENLGGILYANGLSGYMKWNLPMWFIPCLFITVIIFYFIIKFIKQTQKHTSMSSGCIIFTFVAFLTAFLNYYVFDLKMLPFGLEVSVYMLPIMLLGLLMKLKFDIQTLSKPLRLITGLLCVFSGGILAFFTGASASFVSSIYGNLAVFYCSAVLSIIGYALLSSFITNKWILYVGKNSLVILILHKFPTMALQLILEDYMMKSPIINILFAVLITIVSCALSLVAGEIITRIFPMLLGKNKSQNI